MIAFLWSFFVFFWLTNPKKKKIVDDYSKIKKNSRF